MISETGTTIPAASFTDDADAPVVALPEITAADTFSIYVNGVLQQSSLSTLTTASLVLDTIDLLEGTPVSIEVSNFADTTSDMTVPPTISAPTITINS
ncbi:hypothetical protein PA598K_05022 [Paenibacillus sp. 598K]|nr:hypothetical protein PA598K_05022 [Paenibacillus sp. 598K]